MVLSLYMALGTEKLHKEYLLTVSDIWAGQLFALPNFKQMLAGQCW